MKKVLTMTLNPCIDRTIYFDSFKVGGTNIVKKVMEEAAGKGINVAVGLRHLQIPVKALGFAYKENADLLYKKLEEEQILHRFVEVEGRLRVNQKLFDEEKEEMTECNEKGESVTKQDVNALFSVLTEELPRASLLVLSGSVPPGVSTDIYGKMICLAKEYGVKVILDAGGELLLEGIKEGPYLVKPNKEEFIHAFCKDKDKEELTADGIKNVAKDIMKCGVKYICLSKGQDGAVLLEKSSGEPGCREEVAYTEYPAIKVSVKSLQGAGDAMVAGLCKGIYEKRETSMMETAMQMAASTIMLEGTAMGGLNLFI